MTARTVLAASRAAGSRSPASSTRAAAIATDSDAEEEANEEVVDEAAQQDDTPSWDDHGHATAVSVAAAPPAAAQSCSGNSLITSRVAQRPRGAAHASTHSAADGAVAPPADALLQSDALSELARRMAGCRDDAEGVVTKQSLFEGFCERERADAFDTLCALHALHTLTIHPHEVLRVAAWRRGETPTATLGEAAQHGLYLASTLAAFAPSDMPAVVSQYLASNEANPSVDIVAALRFINRRGFLQFTRAALLAAGVADWHTPSPQQQGSGAVTAADGVVDAAWKQRWGGEEGADHDKSNDKSELPRGAPTYVTVRNHRGQRTSIAFLGACDAATPALKTPQEVLMGTWKLPRPTMCICTDAGSMHPRQCDSVNRMCHLPQFYEWVSGQSSGAPATGGEQMKGAEAAGGRPDEGAADAGRGVGIGSTRPDDEQSMPNIGASSTAPADESPLAKFRREAVKTVAPKVRLRTLLQLSLKQWHEELSSMDADSLLGDGSINNIIFTKLKEVFAALLDAATLAGEYPEGAHTGHALSPHCASALSSHGRGVGTVSAVWWWCTGACVVVDRTDGQGSATAELLLELALERAGNQRPILLAIDSLERLGRAKAGARSHGLLRQLHALYHSDGASEKPNGSEPIKELRYPYSLDEFTTAATHAQVPDTKLPFGVLPEHQRKAYNNTCDPNRKWRYFYVDGIFSSATHLVLKNNDTDEFNVESLARVGFLYAHGDSRTYARLRDNIQVGRPIVMLHNSGGVVTAFSWLQRVMANQRPPPDTSAMRGPMRFLVACLSRANWTLDFGVPEMLMMKSLAERAPQLFRKSVISVDILSDSEEQTLEAITSCFAVAGGVPELGLGNAEVNVVYSTWEMHLTLYANARYLRRVAILAQMLVWLLGLVTTTVAVFTPYVEAGKVVEWGDATNADVATNHLAKATLVLPVVTALISTITAKMLWRDKWSVCLVAASQLAAEIYKLRLLTCEYDPPPPPVAEGEEPPHPPTAKEKARLARQRFVERVTALHAACVSEMSKGGTLSRQRTRVRRAERFDYRASSENRPSLAQWFTLKQHVERHYYRTAWAMPLQGSFVSWLSGLRPYLQQQALPEEVRASVEHLMRERAAARLVLTGAPLSDAETTRVRRQLATRLGLPRSALDGAATEIRAVQRGVVARLYREHLAEQAKQAQPSSGGGMVGGGIKAAVGHLNEAVSASSAHSTAQAATSAAQHAEESSLKRGAAKYQVVSDDDDDDDHHPPHPPSTPVSGKSRVKVHPAAAGMSGEHVGSSVVDDDPLFDDGASAMRAMLMELQGAPAAPARASASAQHAQEKERRRATMRRRAESKQVDDDYLVGPMAIESYVVFRVRPLVERLEQQVRRLAWRLQFLDVLGFAVNSSGAVLAAYGQDRWIALTVAFASVLSALVEFTQLRDQVVAMNLALSDLSAILVWWDSLSLVRRRTPEVARRIVSTTECAFVDIVVAHTTAASNTQLAVEKALADEDSGDAQGGGGGAGRDDAG